MNPPRLQIVKGHGTRNDFVLVEDPDGGVDLGADLVRRLADRRAGLGGDGVIRVVRSALCPEVAGPRSDGTPVPEWFMDYYNADGSLAEMCGNGLRVFAAHLVQAGHVTTDEFTVATRAGDRTCTVLERGAGGARVRVGMGTWSIGSPVAVRIAGRELPAVSVDVGNPHAVAHLPADLDLAGLDLTVPPALHPTPPHGANVEFVEVLGERHLRMRVHERGVGETQSCGTGACAVAVAHAQGAASEAGPGDAAGAAGDYRVDVPGGTVVVGLDPSTRAMTLTGPAQLVAHGTWELG